MFGLFLSFVTTVFKLQRLFIEYVTNTSLKSYRWANRHHYVSYRSWRHKEGGGWITYLLTYLLTHSLTPWCRILFEKL